MSSSVAAVVATPQDRLQARLADPAVAESLNRLIDRADLLAFVLEALDGFLQRGETVVESVSDSLRELQAAVGPGVGPLVAAFPALARNGAELADVAARPAVGNVLRSGLIDRLGDPQTLDRLDTLLQKLETAVFLLDAVDGFLRRSPEIADSAASLVADLRNTSVDLGELRHLAERTPKIVEALGRLTDTRTLDRVPDLVDVVLVLAESGMLDPKVVRVLGDVGQRLATAYEDASRGPVQPVGAVGLLRAMSEPEVQRGLGLLVGIARRVGRDVR